MAPFLIVVAILIGHSGGNLLHAEKCLIKVRHAKMVVGMNRDVSDFGKHRASLPDCWILFKVEGFCQQCRRSATPISELESRPISHGPGVDHGLSIELKLKPKTTH